MTGIRGIAAVWVMLFHLQQSAGKYFGLPSLERSFFMPSGWHAVDLFFMLSGFILMHAHGRDFYALRRASLLRFAKLRFTRVYPLNSAVVLLIGGFIASTPSFIQWMRITDNPDDFSEGSLFRTLFLANRWFIFSSRGNWNEPVWSLSLEVLGYAMFPMLAFGICRFTRCWQALVVAIGSLMGLMCCAVAKHYLYTNFVGQGAVVRMASCLIAGVAICRLRELAAEHNYSKWAPRLTATAVLGIAIACVVPQVEVLINFLFAFLLLGLGFQVGAIHALLSQPLPLFLGRISFPLYLVHGMPLLWLRYFVLVRAPGWSHLEMSVVLVLWGIGCILIATSLHFLIERPAHALGRLWAKPKEDRPLPRPQTA